MLSASHAWLSLPSFNFFTTAAKKLLTKKPEWWGRGQCSCWEIEWWRNRAGLCIWIPCQTQLRRTVESARKRMWVRSVWRTLLLLKTFSSQSVLPLPFRGPIGLNLWPSFVDWRNLFQSLSVIIQFWYLETVMLYVNKCMHTNLCLALNKKN